MRLDALLAPRRHSTAKSPATRSAVAVALLVLALVLTDAVPLAYAQDFVRVGKVLETRAEMLDETPYATAVPNGEKHPSKWVEGMLDPLVRISYTLVANAPAGVSVGEREHSHYGYEQVLYVKQGLLLHADAHHREGALHDGELQWLRANSGVVHFHKIGRQNTSGSIEMMQLWINGPDSDAVRDAHAPQVQELGAHRFPTTGGAGWSARVLAGSMHGVHSPVRPSRYTLLVDYELEDGAVLTLDMEPVFAQGLNAVLFTYSGSVRVGELRTLVDSLRLATLEPGLELRVEAVALGSGSTRFVLFAGTPVYEQLARYQYHYAQSWPRLSKQVERLKDGNYMPHPVTVVEHSTLPSPVLVFNATKAMLREEREREEERARNELESAQRKLEREHKKRMEKAEGKGKEL